IKRPDYECKLVGAVTPQAAIPPLLASARAALVPAETSLLRDKRQLRAACLLAFRRTRKCLPDRLHPRRRSETLTVNHLRRVPALPRLAAIPGHFAGHATRMFTRGKWILPSP